jgi:hypothetical protein
MRIFVSTILAGLLLASAPAHAQATRTWVSGVGDDANPCSRTAPCKTWAGAISKTAPGGEIDALDPGGFGGVTITKSITLDGGGGQVASVLVAGVNGIFVAAQPNDIVILRNLRFEGILGNGGNPANSGQSAIVFQSGSSLVIDKCDIVGFAVHGVSIAQSQTSTTLIRDTTVRNVGVNNVNVTSTSGTAAVTVANSSFVGRLFNSALNGGGVLAGANSVVTVTGSDLSNFQTALGAINGGNLTVDRSTIVRSTTGINIGAGSTTNLTNNTFVNNVNALAVAGTVASAQNNTVIGSTQNPNASLPLK